jgi:NTE family protein
MKIGLVLSGGGARGIAHLGAIKALNEMGYKPDAISGTSAGSIAGAMTAAGYSPDFVMDIILSTSFLKHLKPAFNRFGLFKIERLAAIFEQYIPHNSFEKLKIPLTVAATDLENGKIEYFDKGELITPILASCCLPGFFEPIKYQGKTYVDGGVLNNLPIEPLQNTCDFIIGVNVTPVGIGESINSMKDVVMKSMYLAIHQNSVAKLKLCNLAIEPPELYRHNGLSLSNAKDLFNIGYAFTRQVAEKQLAIS